MRLRSVGLAGLVFVLSGCDKKETKASGESKLPLPGPLGGPETKPAETKPPETKPPETKPAEIKPPETKSGTKAGWVLYTHPDKLMSARFPGKPQESEQEAPSPIGPVRFRMAMFADNARAFMAGATVYDVPKGTNFDVEKALDGGRDQMLKNINGKATSEKAIQRDGFKGREIAFEATAQNMKLNGIAQVYASSKPPAGYVFGVIRMNDSPDPDTAPFLDSIHLGRAVETAP